MFSINHSRSSHLPKRRRLSRLRTMEILTLRRHLLLRRRTWRILQLSLGSTNNTILQCGGGDSTLYTDLRKAVKLKPQKRKKHLRRKPEALLQQWRTNDMDTPTKMASVLANRRSRHTHREKAVWRDVKTRDPLDGGFHLLRSPWWHVLLVGGEEFFYLQTEFAMHKWCCVHRIDNFHGEFGYQWVQKPYQRTSQIILFINPPCTMKMHLLPQRCSLEQQTALRSS